MWNLWVIRPTHEVCMWMAGDHARGMRTGGCVEDVGRAGGQTGMHVVKQVAITTAAAVDLLLLLPLQLPPLLVLCHW